jgi:DNA-directed RNA polymerase subunit beta'
MNINFLINKYEYEFLKFQSIRISLASPKKIKQWTKTNSNNIINKFDLNQSRVLNPKTFNYKTLKPEKGGLFCENIFGSLNNLSNRRYKLGYIELIFPVTHIWYLKGSISYISIILNLKKKIWNLLYIV